MDSSRVRESSAPRSLASMLLFSLRSDDSAPKFADYRPIFFEGRATWIPESSSEMVQSFQPPLPPPIPHVRNMERTTTMTNNNNSHPFNQFEDQQQAGWTTTTTTTRVGHPSSSPVDIRILVLLASKLIQRTPIMFCPRTNPPIIMRSHPTQSTTD